VSKEEKKLQVKFEKTCKRQYKSFEIKSDCFESDDQIIDEIFRKAVKDENRNDLVHITLKGYTMPGYRINAAKRLILEAFSLKPNTQRSKNERQKWMKYSTN